jgi:NitT/TauT family transport system ATP-binding protein
MRFLMAETGVPEGAPHVTEPAPAEGALEFDRVTRDFTTPGGRVYRAIEQVSLAVPAGAFVALVGPSGCGKSTLLNIAAGLLAPTSGGVRVEGRAFTGLNPRATYMFQQDALLPWKTVRDNVALGLVLGGHSLDDARARADAWLGRVGLAGFETHYPSQLSGGMRKRVTMAQNWILGRSQLLMDEPFSALDVHTRQLMESELLALWDADAGIRDSGSGIRPSPESRVPGPGPAPAATARRTVLFVTHDLQEAIALADEVVVLSAGPASRIVARHPVTLTRPRHLLDLQASAGFAELYRALWSVLREEVVKSQHVDNRHA